MTILFNHTKTKHGKRDNMKPFHLSTNSDRPWVCPVTAVALCLMMTYHDGKEFFESASAAKNYVRAFDAALQNPKVRSNANCWRQCQ